MRNFPGSPSGEAGLTLSDRAASGCPPRMRLRIRSFASASFTAALPGRIATDPEADGHPPGPRPDSSDPGPADAYLTANDAATLTLNVGTRRARQGFWWPGWDCSKALRMGWGQRGALPGADCKELAGDAGDGLADGVADDGGGNRVVRRGVTVDDDQAGAGLGGDGAQRGGGLDGERTADGQEEVAVGGRGGGAVEDARVQRLAEHHGGRLEDPAAPRARRVVLAGPDPVESGGHVRAVAAGGAHHGEHRAVQLDDPFVRRAGPLVQPVDVLRDHLGVDLAAGQPGEGAVRRVGLGGPRGVRQPGAPG